MNPARLSGTELAAAIASGEVGAAESMEAVLSYIHSVDHTVNAYITVDNEGAMAAAEAADAALAAGDPVGPLHGVPFSVKDLLDTAGVRTTYGSRACADNVPTTDTAAVARLREAGAILVGKTATPEFAAKVPTSSLVNGGATRNPWNTTRSPGGSSGGAGAAVASGMGPLAVSTDGAGSSRIPASACGILGLKATIGRIPHESWPDHFANNSSTAINTRTTQDLVAMLNVMSGAHAGDPWSRGTKFAPVSAGSGAAWLAGRKLLVIPALGSLAPDAEVFAPVERLIEQLAEAGAAVETTDLDPTGYDQSIVSQILISNLVARMRRMPPEQRDLLEPAFAAVVNDPEFRVDGIALQSATLERSRMYDRLEGLFETYDLVLTPTLKSQPPPSDPDHEHEIYINGELNSDGGWFTHLSIANMTGHPAISVPAGFDTDWLPVGLHAIGKWGDEQALINLASSVDELKPWHNEWPNIDA